MNQEIDREVLLGFVEEARGYLPRILEGIDLLHRDPTNSRNLEETHRLTHSIKGAASMLGLPALAGIAFCAEEALEQVAAGQLPPDGDTAEVLLDTAATIGRYLDQLVSGRLDERPLVAQVVTAFRRLRGLPEAGDEAEIDRLCPTEETPHLAPLAAAPTPRETAPADRPIPVIAEDLLDGFREEARDHLAEVGSGLRRLEKDPADRQALDGVRRTVHTLKGAAAMVGLAPCAELAHRMEDLLDHLHETAQSPDREQLDLLFATSEALEDLTGEEASSDSTSSLAELYGRFDDLLGAAKPPSPAPSLSSLDFFGEAPDLELTPPILSEAPDGQPKVASHSTGPTVRVPMARLDEVVRLVSELVVSHSAFERHFQHLGRDVGEFRLSSQRLRRLSNRFESQYEAFALTRASSQLVAAGGSPQLFTASPDPASDFDELELDRYTEIHRISRQLGESTNDLGTLQNALGQRLGDFEGYLNRVSRLTGEVQDKLMRLRMVPMAHLASRLHRAVRVTSRKQGKRVELSITGEDTALDKTVLDEIADPLLHLLRNAVDHGIEPPSLRRALSKDEIGRIRLRAYHEGTQVVIQVGDDGGGLEEEKMRLKALEMGRISEQEAAEASTSSLQHLLFEPGFSTASEISEVSGRGVGLDVVKSVVHRLEGTVAVHSEPGTGTTFTIRLPLTLAVMRAVLVESHEHVYALPLGPVRQILRLEEKDVELLGNEAVVRFRDRTYPAIRLSEALGQDTGGEPPPRRTPALVLEIGEQQVALLVDRIVEARDVVVKSLGNLLRRAPGVTGATLMGDGSVVLILDPQDLVGSQAPRPLDVPRPKESKERRNLQIMVVDDSVSVRRVLSNLLKGQGWEPITARDGLEALEIIERLPELPDAMLLDIEMPRMDGYELTTNLRNREVYRDLPIIMLTSRAGEKHRRRAFEIGATEYVVKPYQDEVLIQLLRRLTHRTDGRASGP